MSIRIWRILVYIRRCRCAYALLSDPRTMDWQERVRVVDAMMEGKK